MADYYPVIARAVSRLAHNSASARAEVYEHARGFLIAQLRGQKSDWEIMDELVALEMAIRKVETAPGLVPPERSATPLPIPSTAPAAGEGRARSDLRARRPKANGAAGPPLVEPVEIGKDEADRERPDDDSLENPSDDLSGLPQSLGAMLVVTAFIVGMTAFIGVVYVRGLVLVAAHVIGHSVLLVVIAALSGLLIFLPLMIFRSARIMLAIDSLLKFAYWALRRGYSALQLFGGWEGGATRGNPEPS